MSDLHHLHEIQKLKATCHLQTSRKYRSVQKIHLAFLASSARVACLIVNWQDSPKLAHAQTEPLLAEPQNILLCKSALYSCTVSKMFQTKAQAAFNFPFLALRRGPPTYSILAKGSLGKGCWATFTCKQKGVYRLGHVLVMSLQASVCKAISARAWWVRPCARPQALRASCSAQPAGVAAAVLEERDARTRPATCLLERSHACSSPLFWCLMAATGRQLLPMIWMFWWKQDSRSWPPSQYFGAHTWQHIIHRDS